MNPFSSQEVITPLGMTTAAISQIQQRADNAVILMGGLLGDNYLLAECTEGIMTEAISAIRQFSWYRHQIKHDFREALRQLNLTNLTSVKNSQTNPEYMREVADQVADRLKPVLVKLENLLVLRLGHDGVKQNTIVAKLVVVDILLAMIEGRYQDILDYVSKEVYNDREWLHNNFGHASCTGIRIRWGRAMEAACRILCKEVKVININNIPEIGISIHAIRNVLRDPEGTIKTDVVNTLGFDGSNSTVYEKAISELNLPDHHDHSTNRCTA